MTLEVLALVVAAVVVVAAVAATSVSIISDSLTLVNNLFLLNVRTTSVNLTIIENKAGVKIHCSVFFLSETGIELHSLGQRWLVDHWSQRQFNSIQPFQLSRLTSDGLTHLLNAKFQ